MPFSTVVKKATIVFPSIAQLSGFKKACVCADFYVDRDALSLVGSFTEEQLQIANHSYAARFIIDDATAGLGDPDGGN